jgi:hypothetical protein
LIKIGANKQQIRDGYIKVLTSPSLVVKAVAVKRLREGYKDAMVERLTGPLLNLVAPYYQDKAALAQPPGGIDLNQINVLRNGKTVNVQFDPVQLRQLEQGGFEGFTPVIINITHISSPFQLLGINPAKEPLAKV